MLNRLRLLPTVMLVAAMLLGLKVVHLIGGLSDVSVVARAQAQSAEPTGVEKPADVESKPEHDAKPEGEAKEAGSEHDAQSTDAAGSEHASAEKPEKAHRGADPAPSPEQTKAALEAQTEQLHQTPTSPAEIAILGSLSERREEIEKRAQALDLREQLLTAAEKRVNDRIAELKAIEAKINSQIASNDKANDERLKSVVQMYETMKPKDAARIFGRLDMGVLIDVAKRMNPRKMAVILAAMDPVTAQDLTVELATGDHLTETPDAKIDAAKSKQDSMVPLPGKSS